MKHLLFICFSAILIAGCEKDVMNEIEEPLPTKEAIGERTTSWINAIANKNVLVFENGQMARKEFSVSKVNETPTILPIFDREIKGDLYELETVSYLLRNTSNSNELMQIKLLGNRYVYFNDTEISTDDNPYLFRLFVQKGILSNVNFGYNVQVGYRNNQVVFNDYVYGSAFPNLGTDQVNLTVSKPGSFLRNILFTQQEGIKQFKDAQNQTWTLIPW